MATTTNNKPKKRRHDGNAAAGETSEDKKGEGEGADATRVHDDEDLEATNAAATANKKINSAKDEDEPGRMEGTTAQRTVKKAKPLPAKKTGSISAAQIRSRSIPPSWGSKKGSIRAQKQDGRVERADAASESWQEGSGEEQQEPAQNNGQENDERQEEGSQGDDGDASEEGSGEGYVQARATMSQLIQSSLYANIPLLQALNQARGEFFGSLKPGTSVRATGKYTMDGMQAWDDIKRDLESCPQLAEIQQLRAKFAMLTENGETMLLLLGAQDLFHTMVEHVVLHGADDISDMWKRTSISLITVRELWQKYQEKGYVVTQKAAVLPAAEWSDAKLDEFSDRRVNEELESAMGRVPTLTDASNEYEFMLWLMRVAKAVVQVDDSRKLTPIYERVWREMARVIKAGVPDRWQSFVEPLAFERSPQILIDTMLKATTKVRDKALQQMRNKLNSIINGPFWTAANLARDMVRVDRLGLRQSMRQ